MGNLTREERAKRDAEKEDQLRKEIEEKVRSEIKTDGSDLKKENEDLRNQLSQMMEMIKGLQKTKEKNIDNSDNVLISDDINSVDMSARISVTSITTGGVNMKTSSDGSARHFRLEKLGQTIPIVYEHLINCISTDRWLFEDGLVYINNAKVVREQYLEEFYQKFLTPEKIENIMAFDVDTIINMVSSTTTAIQETIATFIADKINKGGYIDMNKVVAIGNACNPKIDIRDLSNKLR